MGKFKAVKDNYLPLQPPLPFLPPLPLQAIEYYLAFKYKKMNYGGGHCWN